MSIHKRASRKFAIIENAAAYVSATALAIMVIATVVDVILRHFFSETLVWESDLATSYLAIIAFFLALARTHRVGDNVRLDFLTKRMPSSVVLALDRVSELLTLGFFAILLYVSTQRAYLAFVMDERGGVALPWPMWTSYVFVPIGSLFIIIRLVLNLLDRNRSIEQDEQPESGIEL